MQDALTRLIKILNDYVAVARSSGKALPADYVCQLLSPANPLLPEPDACQAEAK